MTRTILIDNFPIDALLTETHTYASEITEFPVESGSQMADHIRPRSIEVAIEGIVSDTPVGAIELMRDLEGEGANTKPSEEAYARLIRIRDARQPVTIVTSKRAYENMGMETFEERASSKDAGGLFFSATFRQLSVTTNRRAELRTAVPRAQPKTGGGPKAAPDAKFVDRKVDKASGTWFDPDINGWRYSATLNPKTGKYIYFKGALLDGFTGTDAECIAHLNATRDRSLVPVTMRPDGKITANQGDQMTITTEPQAIDNALLDEEDAKRLQNTKDEQDAFDRAQIAAGR